MFNKRIKNMLFFRFTSIILLVLITPSIYAQNSKISFMLKGIERQTLNSTEIKQKIHMSSINYWNMLDHYSDVLIFPIYTL